MLRRGNRDGHRRRNDRGKLRTYVLEKPWSVPYYYDDARGRLVGAVSQERAYSYDYNALGQRITKDSPEGQALPGDINGDGRFSAADVVQLIAILLGRSDPVPAADCNGDGEITRKDVPCVAKKLGSRTAQTEVATTFMLTHYAYDLNGRIIGEFDNSGQLVQEYVWLGDQPIALLRADATDPLYVHADHLNTPRVITDVNQAILWRWDNEEPFGQTAANEDPDGDGFNLAFNLRFPGQYFDAETNNHYNYFRDYNPETGRYIESDPIGLEGGLNTFGYVEATPLTKSDPEGKQAYGPFGFDPSEGPITSGQSLMAAQGSLGLILTQNDECVLTCIAMKQLLGQIFGLQPAVKGALYGGLVGSAQTGRAGLAIGIQAGRQTVAKANPILLPVVLANDIYRCEKECECQQWKPAPYQPATYDPRGLYK